MQQRYDGLRSFLEECEKHGEVKVIRDADWNLEIGALTEIGAEQNEPALLFDDIKDYPKGFRVLSNIFAGQKRTARQHATCQHHGAGAEARDDRTAREARHRGQ